MKLFSRERILYTPGPLTEKRYPEVVAATKRVLNDLGIPYTTSSLMSGFEAWFAGHEEEFQTLMRRNKEVLEREKITRIITNDPHEAYTYRERYGLDARHVIEEVKEHAEKIVKGEARRLNYHHACFLDRLGITPAAVKSVLRRANIHIPLENKDRGCCGSVGHDFSRNNPELAKKMVKKRLEQFDKTPILVCCPHCLQSFGRRRARDVMEALAEAIE